MEKIDRKATNEDGNCLTEWEWLCKVTDKLDEIVDWINRWESGKPPLELDSDKIGFGAETDIE